MKKNKNFPHDYDIDNLVNIDLGDFTINVTKRFEEHYRKDYEKFSSDLFKNFVKEDSVVVDVGANYGYYALLASTINKKGRTFAIEPVKENHEVLNKNLGENKFGQVDTLNIAISDKSDNKAVFNITEASDSAGFYEHPNTKTLDKRTIKAQSLDNLFKDKKIDVLKIDTEGHEISVLEGAKELLGRNENIKVFVEFNPKCIKMSGQKPEKLIDKIVDFGFDIFIIDDNDRKMFKIDPENFVWTDYLEEGEYRNLLCIKKKKSLFVTFFSHAAELEGAERSLLDKIDGLLEKGALVHFLSPFKGLLEGELKKRPVSYEISYYPWWIKGNVKDREDLSLKILDSSPYIINKIKKINPDIIYTNTSVINIGALTAKALKKPHVWNITEYGLKMHGIEYVLEDDERMDFVNKYSDIVIFNSHSLRKHYGARIDEEKAIVIHNVPVPKKRKNDKTTEYYFKNKDYLKLLILGSIQEGKRQKDAVIALKNVLKGKKKSGKIELVIVGREKDKKYSTRIKKFIKKEGLKDHAKILDFCEDPLDIIMQSDVVIMCSEKEAFGRVTAESLMVGRPVIGAKSGGTVELIKDDFNGFLYELGDTEALASHIKFFLENKKEIKKFGENAKRYMNKNFSVIKYLNDIYGALDRLKLKSKESTMQSLELALLKEMERKNENIKSLEKEINDKSAIIEAQNTNILELNQEIHWMRSSKFWKIRNIYSKMKKVPQVGRILIKKSILVFKREGAVGFIRSVIRNIGKDKSHLWEIRDIAGTYFRWMRKNELYDAEGIKREIKEFQYLPKFSIILPVYNVSSKWLDKCVQSVLDQVYDNWELCIHDDKSTKLDTLEYLKKLKKNKDKRIKISFGKKNQHISGASNESLKLARGDFVVLLDNDDELSPIALYENAKLLNEHSDVDMIYSDEDKISEKGERSDPFFKPDWSLDLFLSVMYTCHLGVYRKSIVDRIGGFRKGYDGAQDYDLVLRFIENTKPERIYHIPKILYHWRMLKTSTALGAGSKMYAFEAGKKAIQDYLDRNGIEGEALHAKAHGFYRVKRDILKEELVSIIIPFRDHAKILERCVNSILEKTIYKNFEIILVNNESKKEETAKYLGKVASNEKISVINYDKPFNFSAINNTAVKKARGKYILLLNNDMEIINEGWLSSMIEHIQRDEVGAVGAKLIYPNNTIQHGGVYTGIGGVAGHCCHAQKKNSLGYMGQLISIREFNAVTAACLLTKKEVYEEVGGMDDINFPVSFNDIDFCLKIREKGYKIIFTPYTEIYHYESLSRGYDYELETKNPEEFKRVVREIKSFQNKWKKYIEYDEFYNPNFSFGNDGKIFPEDIQQPSEY